MQRRIALAATALLVGCPSSHPSTHPSILAPAAVDTALRIRVAQAEARRSGGVTELIELATGQDRHATELALRGLGRIGGPEALAALKHALGDRDRSTVAAALSAIGVAASLDELDAAVARELDLSLLPAYGSSKQLAERLAAIEALGRAGALEVQPNLVQDLGDRDPAIAEAAAIALARHGRRKLELGADARAALVVATRHLDADVRYGAVYALAREQRAKDAPPDEAVASALAARIQDEYPETRAQAISALAKRGSLDQGSAAAVPGSAAALPTDAVVRNAIKAALRDPDWRVAVEAVRALAGDHGDDAGRDAVAAVLVRRWTQLVRGDDAEAHVLIEALRLLASHADRPLVAAALTALVAETQAEAKVFALTRGWIECLAIAATTRASAHPDLDAVAACGHGMLPDHLRLPILADLVTSGAGDASTRRAALRILLAHADGRVRAAGIGALVATWKDGDAADHASVIGTLTSALGATDLIVVGTAVDAVPAIYDAIGDQPEKAVVDAAVVARATSERDVELSAALYELIGKRKIASGADACRIGLTPHPPGDPVRVHAASECLKQLGEPQPLPISVPVAVPPVDVATSINHDLRWHLVTSRGEIVIALRPDVAPWNVATVVALTRKGFYDGLELHRVVPNFVAQGGDPTMTGAGGPGFTIPAEPGTALDHGGFSVGGVGMADAGRDSGGSQWFVMQSRAAHLDGRYTWIGTVITGQKSADALLIGDRVVHATVEDRAPP